MYLNCRNLAKKLTTGTQRICFNISVRVDSAVSQEHADWRINAQRQRWIGLDRSGAIYIYIYIFSRFTSMGAYKSLTWIQPCLTWSSMFVHWTAVVWSYIRMALKVVLEFLSTVTFNATEVGLIAFFFLCSDALWFLLDYRSRFGLSTAELSAIVSIPSHIARSIGRQWFRNLIHSWVYIQIEITDS